MKESPRMTAMSIWKDLLITVLESPSICRGPFPRLIGLQYQNYSSRGPAKPGEPRTGRGVARRSREARAGPRRLVADAGARRASRPARALEEGERARGRPGGGHPGKQGPRGGAGGGTAVPPLPRKPSRSHARARTHVHTVGSEDTSGSP
ncbi:DDB1- and CUL4-associated factor 16 isoform X2 [Rousettus aegyptiacus]|uniref:DDB1- and CUL4-associated factor 16 isoform X2 n=1 Tax=Rousettus aegyptiacus TaxID=9407 RepID=UPI00168D7842|nr:DDB1- and CUL4-associated factor 16 isoform X2 [Rousettus aegyptiacus]